MEASLSHQTPCVPALVLVSCFRAVNQVVLKSETVAAGSFDTLKQLPAPEGIANPIQHTGLRGPSRNDQENADEDETDYGWYSAVKSPLN